MTENRVLASALTSISHSSNTWIFLYFCCAHHSPTPLLCPYAHTYTLSNLPPPSSRCSDCDRDQADRCISERELCQRGCCLDSPCGWTAIRTDSSIKTQKLLSAPKIYIWKRKFKVKVENRSDSENMQRLVLSRIPLWCGRLRDSEFVWSAAQCYKNVFACIVNIPSFDKKNTLLIHASLFKSLGRRFYFESVFKNKFDLWSLCCSLFRWSQFNNVCRSFYLIWSVFLSISLLLFNDNQVLDLIM